MVRIALFGGLAAPRQGFHYIQHVDNEDDLKDMANFALNTITRGSVPIKRLENEFKGQFGPNSTERWFAKSVTDNVSRMRFPIAKKIDDLAFFAGLEMRNVRNISCKLEKMECKCWC